MEQKHDPSSLIELHWSSNDNKTQHHITPILLTRTTYKIYLSCITYGLHAGHIWNLIGDRLEIHLVVGSTPLNIVYLMKMTVISHAKNN